MPGFPIVLAVAALLAPAPSAAQTCSLETLARAAAVDTAGLRATAYEGPLPFVTEGGAVRAFHDASGVTRAVAAEVHGETYRGTMRFWLLGPRSFVVEQVTHRYDRPIRADPSRPLAVVERYPAAAYVCDGRVIAGDREAGEGAVEILAELRALPALRMR